MENNNELLKGYNVHESPMLEFYRGKCIFITGGTGFLGKLFLEKLLRYKNNNKIVIEIEDLAKISV